MNETTTSAPSTSSALAETPTAALHRILSPLEEPDARAVALSFGSMFERIGEWQDDASRCVVKSEADVGKMDRARSLRLEIRRTRVDFDKARKALKAGILAKTKAVDGAFAVFCSFVEPLEERLRENEEFAARARKAREDAVASARRDVLSSLEYPAAAWPETSRLGAMSEDEWAEVHTLARDAKAERLERARVAEEVRRETEARLERERAERRKAEEERLERERVHRLGEHRRELLVALGVEGAAELVPSTLGEVPEDTWNATRTQAEDARNAREREEREEKDRLEAEARAARQVAAAEQERGVVLERKVLEAEERADEARAQAAELAKAVDPVAPTEPAPSDDPDRGRFELVAKRLRAFADELPAMHTLRGEQVCVALAARLYRLSAEVEKAAER